jgi:large subunit ribosomal protein L9
MAAIKLLLKESIKNVGKVGDVVEVSPGYARNYLLPRDLAVEPTPSNVKKIEARRKEIEKIERERLEAQAALIKTLEGVEVTLERRANEQGNLFGSVTATDIARALQGQGHNVLPEDVYLPGKLDRIDVYMVKIKFAEELETNLKVYVAPDPESKAAIDAAAKNRTTEAPASNFEGSARYRPQHRYFAAAPRAARLRRRVATARRGVTRCHRAFRGTTTDILHVALVHIPFTT